jgi:hypothetical protein
LPKNNYTPPEGYARWYIYINNNYKERKNEYCRFLLENRLNLFEFIFNLSGFIFNLFGKRLNLFGLLIGQS